jgi:hypothetical protein
MESLKEEYSEKAIKLKDPLARYKLSKPETIEKAENTVTMTRNLSLPSLDIKQS